MQVKKCLLSVLAISVALLTGCKKDVNLNDVDTSMKVNVGAAMPIGTLAISLNDVLGTSMEDGGIELDSVTGEMALVGKFQVHRIIEPFNAKEHVKPVGHRNLYLIDAHPFKDSVILDYNTLAPLNPDWYPTSITDPNEIPENSPFWSLPHTYTGNDQLMRVDFPVSVKMDDINKPGSKIRVDRLKISAATFQSVIDSSLIKNLQWDYIEKIDVLLGKEYKPDALEDTVQVVYPVGGGDYGFKKPMDMTLLNFMMDLQNQNPLQSWTEEQLMANVKDSSELTLRFYMRVPQGQKIYYSRKSGFDYQLEISVLNYYYTWGWIAPEELDERTVEDKIRLADYWGTWADTKDSKLPFADPEMDFVLTTKVAGNTGLKVNRFFSVDNTGKEQNASFDGAPTKLFTYGQDQLLNPLYDANIPLEVHLPFHMDYKPENGHIDQLFLSHPEEMGFNLGIEFLDQPYLKQVRLPSEMDVTIDTKIHAPFHFQDSTLFVYNDTIKGINLETISIDSLVEAYEWLEAVNDAKVQLGLTYSNDLKVDAVCDMVFLDSNNNPTGFMLTDDNRIILKGGVTPTSGGVVIKTLDLKGWETFCKTHSIALQLRINDKSWREAKNKQGAVLCINAKDKLKLSVAVAASIEAIVNFGKNNNN